MSIESYRSEVRQYFSDPELVELLTYALANKNVVQQVIHFLRITTQKRDLEQEPNSIGLWSVTGTIARLEGYKSTQASNRAAVHREYFKTLGWVSNNRIYPEIIDLILSVSNVEQCQAGITLLNRARSYPQPLSAESLDQQFFQVIKQSARQLNRTFQGISSRLTQDELLYIGAQKTIQYHPVITDKIFYDDVRYEEILSACRVVADEQALSQADVERIATILTVTTLKNASKLPFEVAEIIIAYEDLRTARKALRELYALYSSEGGDKILPLSQKQYDLLRMALVKIAHT